MPGRWSVPCTCCLAWNVDGQYMPVSATQTCPGWHARRQQWAFLWPLGREPPWSWSLARSFAVVDPVHTKSHKQDFRRSSGSCPASRPGWSYPVLGHAIQVAGEAGGMHYGEQPSLLENIVLSGEFFRDNLAKQISRRRVRSGVEDAMGN
jgi:hypothetical protein